MKIIKKYTAIQFSTKKVDDVVKPEFEIGAIRGPYYDRTRPEEIFDTEEEAISWAHKEDKYSRWMILPVIMFDNY